MALIAAAAPPLLPDPDDAQGWIDRELSDPAYRAAEPTGLDRLARDLAERIARLFDQSPGDGVGQLAAIAIVVVVVLVLVAAFLVWGRPRLAARSAAATAVLGGDAATSAAEYRVRAQGAAARGDWDAAIAERVRAIARGLDERLIVSTSPGTTVHAFAARAEAAFPASASALRDAAQAFDDVRYLRRPGTAEVYGRVAALDDRLAAERPVLDEALA